MDRLNVMRVFEQVVAEKGFAAAAHKLDLPSSNVTRLVEELEDHLRVQLLQRTTRSLALSPAGAACPDRVRSILDDIDGAEEAVHDHAREMSGSVRVIAPPGRATQIQLLLRTGRATASAGSVNSSVSNGMSCPSMPCFGWTWELSSEPRLPAAHQ